VLARLRHPLLVRLAAPALLLGLALGVAAPARAAHVRAAERERVAALLAEADAARVEAAVRTAAARTATAADFAVEVARLLADGTGAPSPAADALLQTLFGRLFRALSLEKIPAAALVTAPSSASVHPAGEGEAAGPALALRRPAPVPAPDARPADVAAPRPHEERPGVQPLGP
jgi:hypothetical protein